MDLSKSCRSCMQEVALCEQENFDKDIADMFTFCTKIEVTKEDILPKHFCSECAKQIQSSYKFIRHAHNTNETFKTLLSENKEINDNKLCMQSENVIENSQTFDSDDLFFKEESSTLLDPFTSEDNPLSNIINETKELQTLNVKLESTTNEHSIYTDTLKLDRITQMQVHKQRKRKKRFKKGIIPIKSSYEEVLHNTQQYNSTTMDFLKSSATKHINKYNLTDIVLHEENDNQTGNRNSNQSLVDSDFEKQFDPIPTTTVHDVKVTDTNKLYENICHICKKRFASGQHGLTWLKKHLNQHYQTVNQIPEVKDQIKTKDKNLNEKETDKSLKTCTVCQKSFTSQVWYTKHVEREHKDESQIQYCTHCTKSFSTTNQLRYHARTHVQHKKYACSGCDKRFSLRKHLAVHALTHSEERPYICDKCNMSFKLKHVLITHLKMHENHKPFLCYVCGKSFAAASILEEHMVVHSGERPFSCDQCSYRSGFRSALWRHLQRHADQRRYVCPHCQKAFFEHGGLTRHLRVHSGERPYMCPSCPLGFIDGWKRKVHLMRVHQLTLEDIPRLQRNGLPCS